MITTSIARTAVRVQYQLLRIPLTVLDERVAARYLGDDSPVRMALHHGLHTLDVAAEHLLGSGGAAPDQAASDGRRDAAGAPDSDEVDRVAEQLLTDPDQAPVTGELAEADEEDKRYIASLRAKNIVAEHEAVHGRD